MNLAGDLSGALMVCGTTSNAGKTTMVAGLCRVLSRQGIRVAPFKAQNMALNSAVTNSGHEIGRAQFLQAQAASIEARVEMNPVLLKPTGERTSQVVVMGKAIGEMSAKEYYQYKPELFETVTTALADLRSEHDVVLLEGAGSPAELNLLPHDIVNLNLAKAAGCKAILVGDIDPGGVFAALYGTVKILPEELAQLIRGFVINKFRGDPALLLDGTDQLESLSGIPTFGVVPMLTDFELDAEDSLNLTETAANGAAHAAPRNPIDVAVIRFPRMSNFTDFDPLRSEPHVSLRFVRAASALGSPDLIILPGTKATISDLDWLRRSGLSQAIEAVTAKPTSGVAVLGICGGFQMLGQKIDDRVESGVGIVSGLGLLDCSTRFDHDKVLAQVTATALGAEISGYQIHHGRVEPNAAATSDSSDDATSATRCWLRLASGDGDGWQQGNVYGTTIHGLFESDEFRHQFLRRVAHLRAGTFEPGLASFGQLRNQQLDRLADHLEQFLALDDILKLVNLSHSPGP